MLLNFLRLVRVVVVFSLYHWHTIASPLTNFESPLQVPQDLSLLTSAPSNPTPINALALPAPNVPFSPNHLVFCYATRATLSDMYLGWLDRNRPPNIDSIWSPSAYASLRRPANHISLAIGTDEGKAVLFFCNFDRNEALGPLADEYRLADAVLEGKCGHRRPGFVYLGPRQRDGDWTARVVYGRIRMNGWNGFRCNMESLLAFNWE